MVKRAICPIAARPVPKMHVARGKAFAMFLVMALLAAGCSTSTGARSTTHGQSLSSQYLRIAKAGNDRLEVDIDGLLGRDRSRLSAARADLRDASATERLFDRRLRAIGFPSALRAVATSLYSANQARAALTGRAATSRTLRQLRAYEQQISDDDQTVEQEVRRIRLALRLPPPPTS